MVETCPIGMLGSGLFLNFACGAVRPEGAGVQ